MPAYLIADVTLHDSAAYEEYQQEVPAIIAAHGGRYLVRGGAARVLEGSWLPQRAVVLEFPNMAALETFWASPEYQPMRALRERVARSNIIVVDGV